MMPDPPKTSQGYPARGQLPCRNFAFILPEQLTQADAFPLYSPIIITQACRVCYKMSLHLAILLGGNWQMKTVAPVA
jgi:hypothetical protein